MWERPDVNIRASLQSPTGWNTHTLALSTGLKGAAAQRIVLRL
jgi:hypothetical protein